MIVYYIMILAPLSLFSRQPVCFYFEAYQSRLPVFQRFWFLGSSLHASSAAYHDGNVSLRGFDCVSWQLDCVSVSTNICPEPLPRVYTFDFKHLKSADSFPGWISSRASELAVSGCRNLNQKQTCGQPLGLYCPACSPSASYMHPVFHSP